MFFLDIVEKLEEEKSYVQSNEFMAEAENQVIQTYKVEEQEVQENENLQHAFGNL